MPQKFEQRLVVDFTGRVTTPVDWARELKIAYRPGLILFDQGTEVARTDSMLYPFHFEHVLRFGLNENHEKYASYLDLMEVRQQQLLSQGIDVNIGKPEDW